MAAFASDIETRIDARFKDGSRVRALLAELAVQKERERIVRCILELSDSDPDSVAAWVRRANLNEGELIWYAEFDNRNVRKYDFSRPFDAQIPYSHSE
jgi:hypothetical protein